jgi:two-component system sensor histidine kinase HydH
MNILLAQIKRLFTIRAQAVLLVALCLGSLALLFFNFFAGRVGPEREREVRGELTTACQKMAHMAEVLRMPLDDNGRDLDAQLSSITEKSLTDFPAVEGGFYSGGDRDRFVGYAFPTRPRPPGDPHRNEPPPLEAPYIRLQVRDSLNATDGNIATSVRDVQASEVMIVTAPVGTERPAPLAVWLMYRLVDPHSLNNQVRRYQTSTAMAICGLALAALLLVNLGRSLRTQRTQEVKLRDELRRSEHLAALGKLLAGVAHEVRNPLAAIRSTVQLWQRLPETARNSDSLASVVQAVDRLNQTVTHLLYFSRADHADRQPIDINKLLSETINLMDAQAGSQGVSIERDLDKTLPQVSASANALNQVFVNLIQNALQSLPSGGRIKVTTVRDARRGGAQIEIADNGSGIPPDKRAHLFEPFFTTRPEGTGLGLALCREIVEQHGGRIEYLDGLSTGATFQVTLPEASHQ